VPRASVPPALANAIHRPYWLDNPAAPEPTALLSAREECDLAIVGGGFTGLWTALQAKEADPAREVVLLEGARVGWAATGRNGGFCSSSLTHGLANGRERFADEIETLEKLGTENLDGIADSIACYGIDCGFERTGEIDVATEPYQVEELQAEAEVAAAYGHDAEWLDADAVREQVHSPTYLGGLWDRSATAMVDPARLAWGLRAACLSLGVRLYEHSPVSALEDDAGARLRLRTPHGAVEAARVALGTNAFPPLLRRMRNYVVPVYDYALMTEPLSTEQRDSIGWRNRQGLGDSGNQFHYYRLTDDGRILFGGYDAIYHYGNGIRPALDARAATFTRLADHFGTTFPQLDGVRFTHAWGGAIDTCSRFCAFFGTAYAGRLAYAAGYTGLGVGATRFAGQVLLDLLSGARTPLTRLRMVTSKPVPFPPEPLRWAGIELTRWSLARADARAGRRNLWLRTLDRVGMGYDS
jgi:glycine/D-amino acid oxidase-like deaminating enzyme